jgi:hypothetical protein
MMKKKIVVRLKDKTLLKGEINDFSPFYDFLHLELPKGNAVNINVDKIKAIFFVKSFEGDKKYTYTYEDELPWVGDKILLKFNDGEKMVGYTTQLNYSPKGFFITPADLKGNNTCVFASKSAIKSMSFF